MIQTPDVEMLHMMWSILCGILLGILASWQPSIVFTPDSDFEIAAFLFQRWQLNHAIRWPRYEVKEDLVKEVDEVVDDLIEKVVEASTPSLHWQVCLQWEEERPGHSKPARSPLGSDHLREEQ